MIDGLSGRVSLLLDFGIIMSLGRDTYTPQIRVRAAIWEELVQVLVWHLLVGFLDSSVVIGDGSITIRGTDFSLAGKSWRSPCLVPGSERFGAGGVRIPALVCFSSLLDISSASGFLHKEGFRCFFGAHGCFERKRSVGSRTYRVFTDAAGMMG